MLRIIFYINLLAAAITLINLLTLRRPSPLVSTSKSVAVLIPMRNERHNVEFIINNVLTQQGVEHLSVYAIDDHSSDGTREYLSTIHDSRVIIVDVPELPSGWLGKPHALEVGYRTSLAGNHDVYICIDADVNLDSSAIARAVNSMKERDFISPYPQQMAESMPERLIQPLLQWSWMSSVIVRLAEKFPHPSTAVANGQYFLVTSDALKNIDGFTAIKGEVLDDIQLTKNLIRHGFRGCVIEGASIASTRMYSNASEIYRGYGKSLYPTFKGLGTLLLALFLLIFHFLPFLALFSNNTWAIASVITIIASRSLSAISSRNNALDALLHPIAILFFISILAYSYLYRKSITWKDRTL